MSNLLSLALVGSLILVVNPAKVGDDDGHGQGNNEHTAQRADTSHHFARYRLGHHVAVSAKEEEGKGRSAGRYTVAFQ